MSVDRLRHSTDERVGIIGAGLMGRGIAAVCALAGVSALIVDSDEAVLAEVERFVGDVRSEVIAARIGVSETMGTVTTGSDIASLASTTLVFEAVPEHLTLKRAVFEEIACTVDRRAIIASTTSSFVPSVLAEGLRGPDRFVVAHFWNPPHAIDLVEIVAGAQTSAESVRRVRTFLKAIDMRPIVIAREVAGFIGNRLQFALLREAMHLVQTGVASASEIDAVVRCTLGPRLSEAGPLESADLGGLKTFLAIAEHLTPHLAEGSGALDVLRELISADRAGARSGAGFYDWTNDRTDAVVASRNAALLERRAKRIADLREAS